jgi:hypothetical protein
LLSRLQVCTSLYESYNDPQQDSFPLIGAATGNYRDAWVAFIRAMEAAGVDPTWVRTLPASVEQLGLVNIETDVEVPFFRGGANVAQFWKLTWMQSMEKVLAAGAPRDVIESALLWRLGYAPAIAPLLN